MQTIKYIIVPILFLFIGTHTSTAQKYFKIIDATSQTWTGGMAQSGTGTSYIIRAILLTGHTVKFDEIWIGKDEYGIPEVVSQSYSDGRMLTKGDTILIRYTVHRFPPGSPGAKEPKTAYKTPPIPISGEALLGFTIGKKTRYRSVDKFTQMPHRNYM